MRVAVTSAGKSLDSRVDQRFGRAAYFILVDLETMNFDVLANENVTTSTGAGIGSAKAVVDCGAEAVVTGNCGPKAEQALAGAGVRLYTGVSGTVAEAIELLKSGGLTAATKGAVESHFGAGQ
jgi:predicted Fe-Mo cluster-binding NifX family protein